MHQFLTWTQLFIDVKDIPNWELPEQEESDTVFNQLGVTLGGELSSKLKIYTRKGNVSSSILRIIKKGFKKLYSQKTIIEQVIQPIVSIFTDKRGRRCLSIRCGLTLSQLSEEKKEEILKGKDNRLKRIFHWIQNSIAQFVKDNVTDFSENFNGICADNSYIEKKYNEEMKKDLGTHWGGVMGKDSEYTDKYVWVDMIGKIDSSTIYNIFPKEKIILKKSYKFDEIADPSDWVKQSFQISQLDIKFIKGVGEVTATKLRDAGFNTIEKITNTTINELTEINGIGKASAKKFKRRASNIIKDEKKENSNRKIHTFRSVNLIQSDIKVLKELESLIGKEFSKVRKIKWDTKMGFTAENNRVSGLGLYMCGLSTLPESIGDLTSLKILDLSENKISTLPESIGNLKSLVKLSLWANNLNSLPEEIGNLKSLKKLSLRTNSLTNLPESIGDLTSLEKLDLGWNSITNLPESIGNLSSLSHINLENTKITPIPGSLKKLEQQGLDIFK